MCKRTLLEQGWTLNDIDSIDVIKHKHLASGAFFMSNIVSNFVCPLYRNHLSCVEVIKKLEVRLGGGVTD